MAQQQRGGGRPWWWGLVVLALATIAPSCGGLPGVGGGRPTPTRLNAVQEILDTTIREANLTVEGPAKSTDSGACINDVRPSTNASVTYRVVLNGEDPSVVAKRIAEVWERHAGEWLGGGMTVDTSRVDNPGFARVHLHRDGWGFEAYVPMNPALGEYTLTGGSPCE